MLDKLELSHEEPELSDDNQTEDAETPEIPQNQEELKKIFEERFELFMGQLSDRIEKENVPVAIAIVVDPKYPASPMVFKTGHIFDQARLLANTLRVIKQQIDEELST